jgi:hypothetical protein
MRPPRAIRGRRGLLSSAKSILLNPNWVDDIRQSKELPLYKPEDANAAYTDEPLP